MRCNKSQTSQSCPVCQKTPSNKIHASFIPRTIIRFSRYFKKQNTIYPKTTPNLNVKTLQCNRKSYFQEQNTVYLEVFQERTRRRIQRYDSLSSQNLTRQTDPAAMLSENNYCILRSQIQHRLTRDSHKQQHTPNKLNQGYLVLMILHIEKGISYGTILIGFMEKLQGPMDIYLRTGG